jgi:hypothetical protein
MNYMSHYVDDIIGQDENEDLSVRFDLLYKPNKNGRDKGLWFWYL